jgi:uncharacterized protein YyaL (SSP411 family)
VVVERAEPGDRSGTEGERMVRRALSFFVPRRVVQWIRGNGIPARPLPPAIQGMLSVGTGSGTTRAYACIGTTCSAPAASDAEWAAVLEGLGERGNEGMGMRE